MLRCNKAFWPTAIRCIGGRNRNNPYRTLLTRAGRREEGRREGGSEGERTLSRLGGKSDELTTKREGKKTENSWDGETDRDTCVPKDSEDLAGSFLAGTTGLQTLLGVLWLDERRPSPPRDRRRKVGDVWTPREHNAVKFHFNRLSFWCFFLPWSSFFNI